MHSCLSGPGRRRAARVLSMKMGSLADTGEGSGFAKANCAKLDECLVVGYLNICCDVVKLYGTMMKEVH